MTKYVVGIIFCENKVLLIRKNRPSWQSGGLNGVGGKVSAYESYYDAMVRECREECNLVISNWEYIGMLTDIVDYKVKYYKAYVPTFDTVCSNTDEKVEIFNIADINYSMLISPTDVFLRLAVHNIYEPIELIVERL